MDLKPLPNIDDKWFDHNYTVSLADLANTLICQQGYCANEDEKLIRSILYLFGLDINKHYTKVELSEGQSHRSPITDLVQKGGYVYSGYERTDPVWKKKGKENIAKWLFEYNEELYNTLGLRSEDV